MGLHHMIRIRAAILIAWSCLIRWPWLHMASPKKLPVECGVVPCLLNVICQSGPFISTSLPIVAGPYAGFLYSDWTTSFESPRVAVSVATFVCTQYYMYIISRYVGTGSCLSTSGSGTKRSESFQNQARWLVSSPFVHTHVGFVLL